jgi:hypothetical protein
MARGYTRTDWKTLDPLIDQRKAEGWEVGRIAQDLGVKKSTLVMHLRSRHVAGTPSEYHGTPEAQDTQERLSTPEHPEPPEHPGTLEGHQEVMEEVSQSVPDAPHVGTDEVHPSTPIVHQELSPDDSLVVHPSVPARQGPFPGTPMVHPGTPSEEDWELWSTIKARWLEVEKMLAERQAFLSTPSTPGNTQKKTYVFDVRHIALIDEYAKVHRLELKDVIYAALQEFFERRAHS